MWYAILLLGASEFFCLRAAGGCLARTSQSKPGCGQQTQCKGGAMQNGTRKAHFNFSLAAFDTSKQQAKYGPCTLRDIIKITKVTNIKYSIIEEHI